MGRKKGIFSVQTDEITFPKKVTEVKKDSITIKQALATVFQQMKVSGNR